MKSRKISVLDEIQILEPCRADWETMDGDNSRRFCNQCQRSVFKLSAMTLKQAESLIAAYNGQLCAQIVRRPDGTTVSLDELPPVRLLKRQPWPMATAVITTVLSVGPVLPAAPATKPQAVAAVSIGSPEPRAVSAMPGSAGASIKESQPGAAEAASAQPEAREITVQGRIALPNRTLRTLYDMSEVIVIARVAESTVLQRDGDRILLKTALAVSRTLKGKQHDVVFVLHSTYEGSQSPFEGASDLLVFLKPRHGASRILGGAAGYEVVDSSRAVKTLPPKALEKYADRLTELDSMLRRGRTKAQEVVEWFIRCAEDPATRREGVVDLKDEQNLALLLTASHKERLMNALSLVDEMDDSDIELIKLISRWNEPRLLPFLLTQLRRMEQGAPQIADSIISLVGDILEDETIRELAEAYSDDATYEDLAAKEAGADETEQAEADNEEEPEDPEEEEMAAEDVEPDRPERTPEEALANRRALLRRFIEAVEAKLARGHSS